MYLYGDHPFRHMGKISSNEGIFGSRRMAALAQNETSDMMAKDRAELNAPFAKRHNDFLVNLRSPLDRIASWFVYEHTENHGVGTYKAKHPIL